jgi:hypothetical protein
VCAAMGWRARMPRPEPGMGVVWNKEEEGEGIVVRNRREVIFVKVWKYVG